MSDPLPASYDILGEIDSVITTVSSAIQSKHEEKKLENKKKRLFEAYQEDITVLFESLNDSYIKKELTKESIKVIDKYDCS